MEKYRLIEKRHVNDVDAQVFYYQHIKSGARILKIANSDKNKTFAIAFKTEPEDDCGIPHILEHSVLNGSKKYPIKSPFDQLLKGSLTTYLNAFTCNDATVYPVASTSDKDFFNLMDVYLDAVFNPLLLNDNRILKQEGWRVMLNSKDEMPEYTGVVYNEMKGVYSDPLRELDLSINRSLFPDNGYGLSSGGYPTAIRTLTQEHFVDYYKRHYAPENSYIYLYGDADCEKELEILDGYLSNYTATGNVADIIPQKPFENPKKVVGFYPSDNESSEQNSTYLALSFAIGRNTDLKLCAALDILNDVLINQEDGEIRKAFTEANIGDDIEVWFETIQENTLSLVAHNCNADDAEKFKSVIMSAYQRVAENGIDQEALAGAINRREFALKEGNDAQQGMRRLFEIFMPWIFGSNPIDNLENEKLFAEIKKEIANGLLENVIKQYILKNNHQVLTVFKPKAGLEEENEAKTFEELKKFKESLSEQQIDQLIADTKALEEFQNREETPEELACIPMLQKSDLNPNAEDFPVEIKSINGSKTICYHSFTNDIVYLNIVFNAKAVPENLLPYLSILSEFIGKVDTENFTYGQIDKQIKNNTGSFAFGVATNSYCDKDEYMANFALGGKVLTEKLEKFTNLAEEIVLRSDFSNKQRLKDLMSRYVSRIESDMNSSAYYYVRNRAFSYFDKVSLLDERINGIDYYFFIKDLNKNFDTKIDEIIANLKKVSQLLFSSKNVTIATTCQEKDFDKISLHVGNFLSKLPNNDVELYDWQLVPQKTNEAFYGQSKVQYVIRSFDFKKFTNVKYNGKMSVLSRILSLEFLHTAVRVKGGAYGCFSSFNSDGLMCFSSYRDPNLQNTLDVYSMAADYIKNFDASEKDMLKFIIGTISILDQPMTVAQKGGLAVNRYLRNRKFEDIQRERTEILNVTAQDIRDFAPILESFNLNGAICVYGGEEKINEPKNLFDKIIKLN